MNVIRVAVVDDSAFVRAALERVIRGSPNVVLAGAAACGEELLANLERWRPDVVTLDLNMPGMGGLATLDRIMAVNPLPVIILSTHSRDGAPMAVEALSRGAVDFIDKEAYSLVDFQALRSVLLGKIVQVADASPAAVAQIREARGSRLDERPRSAGGGPSAPYDLVVIGASTGGPSAIEVVLSDLGSGFPFPIAIVQHMPPGFTAAFAERLDRQTPFTVREATSGDALSPHVVYIAAAGRHLTVTRTTNGLQLDLDDEPSDEPHCPSVDVLFASAARALRERVVAVLLTGMGKDGAKGMAELTRVGAHTIAQNEASCIIYGMPRAAMALAAVKESLPLGQIGTRLRQMLVGAGSHSQTPVGNAD